MPLRDHFRSPVNDKHTWEQVHNGWPMMMVQHLFELLPPNYHATPEAHLGSPFEVDVGTYDADEGVDAFPPVEEGRQSAPSPTLTLEAQLDEFDLFELRIYDEDRMRELVAAIEIVSPSNKDRPESREAFLNKVAGLLRKDVCVSIIDLVTIRQANLYGDLLDLVGREPPSGPFPDLYAVTLRGRKPFRQRQRTWLDIWMHPMAVGEPLPTIPIWLSPELSVMFPLEPSYEETCRLQRIK